MKKEQTENVDIKKLFDLSGKIALVTGGAGHLGSSMCYCLAELGAIVVVASRSLDKCDAFAGQLQKDGFHVYGEKLDIQDLDSCASLVDRVLTKHGKIDILVNNAYPFNEKRIDDIMDADFMDSLQGGVASMFRLSQKVSISMKDNGGGSIINIASMYGMVGSYPEMYEGLPACISPAYHAAKGGVLQMTRYLAVYWAEFGIRVNAISPGTFPKASLSKEAPEFLRRLEAKIPLKRVGRPEELKGVIMLLASDAGSYITGSNIVVDGGWTAW